MPLQVSVALTYCCMCVIINQLREEEGQEEGRSHYSALSAGRLGVFLFYSSVYTLERVGTICYIFE